MKNVFHKDLVSKNQFLGGNVLANSFPRKAHMSQYNSLINPILYSDWQATYNNIVRINQQTSHTGVWRPGAWVLVENNFVSTIVSGSLCHDVHSG
jgi:hypothetical protein